MDENKTDKLVTTDTILDYLKEAVQNKESLPPTIWVEAAAKLNVLRSDEDDKLFEMQQELAKEKVRVLEAQEEKNVSAVKLRIEATDLYKASRKQSAKIEMIEEFIRIAKLQARMKATELRGY